MKQQHRQSWRRYYGFVIGAISAGLVLAMSTCTSASADSSPTLTQHVYNTAGIGLYLHPDSPGLNTAVGPIMADGTEFDISCFVVSDDVNGDVVWDFGTDSVSGHTGYAADYYLDTPIEHGNEAAQLAAIGLPHCDAADTTGSTTTGSAAPSTTSYGAPSVSYDRGGATSWAAANLYARPSFEDDDCTWYVSQSLWAGGMPQTDEWTSRSFDWNKQAARSRYPGPTKEAAQANYLVNYLVRTGIATRVPVRWSDNSAGGAQPGDIIAYHWNPGENADQIDHLALVSDLNASGYPNVMQHSNANHRYWSWDPTNDGWIQQVDKIDGQDPGVWLIHINDGPTY